MTLEEYNRRLRQLAVRTGEYLSERVMVVSAGRLLSAIQNRVFRDGLDSNGSRIGNYSTTPYYASKDKFIKKGAFKPVGKGGVEKNIRVRYSDLQLRKAKNKIIHKSGRDRTTMYLKEGYKDFRAIQGRPADVNLQMTGDLKISFSLQKNDKEILIGFNSELQSQKRKWLEQHFKNSDNTIFPATTEEKEDYSKEILNEMRLIQGDIMEGFV